MIATAIIKAITPHAFAGHTSDALSPTICLNLTEIFKIKIHLPVDAPEALLPLSFDGTLALNP